MGGSNVLYPNYRTGTGAIVYCINRICTGIVVDFVISVGLEIRQRWNVGYQ